MTKNKEVDGRCELCGTRGKILRVRKYGHNWKLCRTCRDDKKITKKTMEKILHPIKSMNIGDKDISKKELEHFERLREESIGNLHTKEIEELDSIIKLIHDLRSDAMKIVVKYADMLNELADMKAKLLEE